jgi:putative tryptophan/tyrosine transport system substrate-binding protein
VPALFADVIRQQPDVIVAVTLRMALAAKQASGTIPIVATMSRAVENNLATSLAHPGGNLTGIDVAQTPDFVAKRLQLLKEAVPSVRRVAMLADPVFTLPRLRAVQDLVKPLGITLAVHEAETKVKLEAALAAVAADRPTALFVDISASYLHNEGSRLAEFGLHHRLPSFAPWRELAEAGIMMTYGYNVLDLFRGLAVYVDRILRGAKPGDLPIEQPAKWDFVVNLKTAKAIGLIIPSSVLARADEVIQ